MHLGHTVAVGTRITPRPPHRSRREVRLDYAFDRLLATKLQQVYEILVPDQVRVIRNCSALNGEANENRGDLRQGIVGQAERREDYSESDGSVGGVCPQRRLRRSA